MKQRLLGRSGVKLRTERGVGFIQTRERGKRVGLDSSLKGHRGCPKAREGLAPPN